MIPPESYYQQRIISIINIHKYLQGRIPCPVDRNLEFFLTSHIDFSFNFRCMTWHVIRVRSKDAQKQLARTSLRLRNLYFKISIQQQERLCTA